ncbi:hypothetical protein A3860_24070 [Niastella vici]|uniref:Uncharacterized protein n=1 Tax=Niastella vici TaxID=1703345 RepID=A0A1V9FYL7_9BACT|nr:hypothetical protein [Niastella vici]OQP63424.1 hypothetical protein A3860_24070 [Niastella vici]
MEQEIEIKDSFNHDALDKTPTWIMKWGVLTVLLAIIALLCLAAIIPYDQTISFPVTIGNDKATYVTADASGNVEVNKLTGAQQVKKGDTLLVVSAPEQLKRYVISPCTGYTIHSNNQLFNTNQVKAGDTLATILPIIDPLFKVTAVGYYNGQLPQNLLHSAKVFIKLPETTGNNFAAESRILYASLIAEAGKGHMVMLTPESNSLKKLAELAPLYHGMKATATVIQKQRSILQWIFD